VPALGLRKRERRRVRKAIVGYTVRIIVFVIFCDELFPTVDAVYVYTQRNVNIVS
jgi:hypothetical protein